MTPRSPIFERVPVHKNKDKNNIKIKNENWDRKDGTPSFNKIKFKNIEVKAKNTNKANDMVNQESLADNDEFNISFTNENYNPMSTNRVEDKLGSERRKLNNNDTTVNTRESQDSSHYKMPNKLIHISETYANDNKNFRVAVADDKVNMFKINKESSRKVVRQKFGSPAPVKGVKKGESKTMETNESIPVFNHEVSNSIFPDLPTSNINEYSNNDDLRLENNLKPKKRKRKVMASDVKIMDLQHNMMQFSNGPQMLFCQNGQIIDSTTLREELRALKLKDIENKKQGKLVKPKNPIDMMSVNY